jgi:hypothetical protein
MVMFDRIMLEDDEGEKSGIFYAYIHYKLGFEL